MVSVARTMMALMAFEGFNRVGAFMVRSAPSMGRASLNVTYENCTDAEEMRCADEEHRTCLNYNGTDECDHCICGFVPDLRNNSICANISSLNYSDYVDVHNPTHSDTSLTDEDRHGILQQTANKVSSHNCQSQVGDGNSLSYYLAINHLSAHTDEERNNLNGYRKNNSDENNVGFHDELLGAADDTVPDSINWVELGAVTPVQDQGQCGNCYSFSTGGAIEGIAFIDSNNTFLENVAYQQITSCDSSDSGCGGGDIVQSLRWSAENSFGGLTSDEEYPFVDSSCTEASCTSACAQTGKNLSVEVTSPLAITKNGSPSSLTDRNTNFQKALAKQPMSIAMNANCDTMYNYGGGVLTDDSGCACTSTDKNCLDHAVLMVGYDSTADTPYWLVKNSWGTGWGDYAVDGGERGYFKVEITTTGGDWGLFGVMAEGTVPQSANNVSAEEEDTSDGEKLMVNSVIVSAVSLVALVIGTFL